MNHQQPVQGNIRVQEVREHTRAQETSEGFVVYNVQNPAPPGFTSTPRRQGNHSSTGGGHRSSDGIPNHAEYERSAGNMGDHSRARSEVPDSDALGGFHFPVGVKVPPKIAARFPIEGASSGFSNGNAIYRQQQQQQGAHAGMKRRSDTVAGAATGGRQVLGEVGVDERGQVKRARY